MAISDALSAVPITVVAAAAAALAMCFVIALALAARRRAAAKTACSPPLARVPGLPVIGNAHQLGDPSRLMVQAEEWARAHGGSGAFEFNLPGQRFVVACSADAIDELMRQRPYALQRARAAARTLPGFEGLFQSEGASFRLNKRIVAPAFNHAHLPDFIPTLNAVSSRLVDKWLRQADASPDSPMKIGRDLHSFAADTISLIAFGVDFNSLGSPCAEERDLENLFAVMQNRALADSCFPYWRWLPFGGYLDGGAQTMNRLERWMNKEIDRYEASQRKSSPTTTAQQEHTVLAKMLQRAAADPPRRADEPKFDRKRAMNNLLVLFVGGADTTAVTIGWMLYELARDQALQSEALAEAEKLAAAGEELTSDGKLTSALLSSLPCLGSLFYETLRVRGPAPYLWLQARQPVTLLGRTYEASESTTFIPLTRYVGMSAEAEALGVGANPEQFDARRWRRADPQGVSKLPEVLMPFGHGMRRCPASDLALIESLTCCAAILRSMHLSIPADHPTPSSTVSSFVQVADCEISLVAQPRTSS